MKTYKLTIMVHKDQLIIAGIMNGDERILSRFYKENIRYIQGYILGNCGNYEDVEDVFQDALVTLYQKLQSGLLEIQGPIKTYFFGICKNLWRNRLRKKAKLDNLQNRFDDGAYDPSVTDIENHERENLYIKHFQNLSTDHKELLCLFFEGKSVKEISKIKGYTEGYTRKKKFLAKEQLFKKIEEDPKYEELKAIC